MTDAFKTTGFIRTVIKLLEERRFDISGGLETNYQPLEGYFNNYAQAALVELKKNTDESMTKCGELARKAFAVGRDLELPEDEDLRSYHVLHMSVLACCGDCWPELRGWYATNKRIASTPEFSLKTPSMQLFSRLFDWWVCLFKTTSRQDLQELIELAGLLDIECRNVVFRFWAKGTQELCNRIMSDTGNDDTLMDETFMLAINASDGQLRTILIWLYALSNQIVMVLKE